MYVVQELELLNAILEYRAGGPKPTTANLETLTETGRVGDAARARDQEAAFYLESLRQKGYIDYRRNPFLTGGLKHPVYKNNVVMIYYEEFDITPRGHSYIDSLQL